MTLDPLPPEMTRTHRCGEPRPEHAGQRAVAMGWVARRRDLGSLIFIDLRDRTGVLQVVFNKEAHPPVHARAEQLRSEYVVAVEGTLIRRQPETVNPAIPTGEVELLAERLLILNDARTPPFPLEEDAAIAEDTRLRYRFVDLRRQRMQANLELRHRLNQETRRVMSEHGFLEIETPFLTRSTPEGARDYLVPSRVQQGSFYALPQSPQLFKQLLMISGFDRYFQIVRCFRDEDLRADRQPEFTQLDVEMSFPQPRLLFELIDGLMKNLCAVANRHWELQAKSQGLTKYRPIDVDQLTFPRMPYDEAMAQYGTDKPDLRYEARIVSLDSLVSAALAREVGIRTPILGFKFSPKSPETASGTAIRGEIKAVLELAHQGLPELRARQTDPDKPALLLDFCVVKEGAKLLKDAGLAQQVCGALHAKAGDVLFLGAVKGSAELRDPYLPHRCFDILRRRLAPHSDGYDPQAKRFVWVTEFPMFEYDPDEKRYVAMHHPFTSPTEETLGLLESDPAAVRARAYDLVLNGTEIGGGSIRIHRKDVQARVFKALGMTDEQARQRFGFFLDALEYGTPPHGGIALGMDRITAILAQESSIREVIAFPKTARAVDLMCDAPTPVSPAQLQELGLQLRRELR
ncbi:MAG TPA: aspartate--tRNA ligase [Terriglobia bacterium]|nr:aspartate--tRNA ligase [Terriglobia bacterium]